MAQFKTGDIVCLKSGGPIMTVKWINGTEAVCSWFDSQHNSKSRSFEMDMLTTVEPTNEEPEPLKPRIGFQSN